MKIHKSTLLWTGVTAVAALILYSIFGYMECLKNQWIEDISLAIFGSALLMVVTSIIGYRIEKKELRWKIVQAASILNPVNFARKITGKQKYRIQNGITHQSTLITVMRHRQMSCPLIFLITEPTHGMK